MLHLNVFLIRPAMHTSTCPQHHCVTRKFEAPVSLETLHKVVLGYKGCIAAGRGNSVWSAYLMGTLCFVLFTKCNVNAHGIQQSLPAESACRSLLGTPKSKKPFGRRRRLWDDNIKVASKYFNVRVWNQFMRLKASLL
jgi:hypothetical protein